MHAQVPKQIALNSTHMFFILEVSWTELSVTAAASLVAIIGVVLNAKRYHRPFPTRWIVAFFAFALLSHSCSFWARSKWPAFIGLMTIVALAVWLRITWRRDFRHEELEGENG